MCFYCIFPIVSELSITVCADLFMITVISMTPPVITGESGDRNLRLSISHCLVKRSQGDLLNLLSDASYNRPLYSLKSNPAITQGGHEMLTITDYFAG